MMKIPELKRRLDGPAGPGPLLSEPAVRLMHKHGPDGLQEALTALLTDNPLPVTGDPAEVERRLGDADVVHYRDWVCDPERADAHALAYALAIGDWGAVRRFLPLDGEAA